MSQLKEHYDTTLIEAGCDEAGRGCLAGPVYAAAVVLPHGYSNPDLDDSKKLTPKQREVLRLHIERNAVAWAVVAIDNNEIDRTNILRASLHAMNMAVARLAVKPQLLLIDGNRFIPESDIPHVCIVKGDAQYQSIAAASILAKTHRDACMEELHKQYPQYGWNNNKGYPTAQHYDAIEKHGLTPLHRRSFRLERQTSLNLEF